MQCFLKKYSEKLLLSLCFLVHFRTLVYFLYSRYSGSTQNTGVDCCVFGLKFTKNKFDFIALTRCYVSTSTCQYSCFALLLSGRYMRSSMFVISVIEKPIKIKVYVLLKSNSLEVEHNTRYFYLGFSLISSSGRYLPFKITCVRAISAFVP